METIHNETYSLLIDTYVKDTEEKKKLFQAIENFESIKRSTSGRRDTDVAALFNKGGRLCGCGGHILRAPSAASFG